MKTLKIVDEKNDLVVENSGVILNSLKEKRKYFNNSCKKIWIKIGNLYNG